MAQLKFKQAPLDTETEYSFAPGRLPEDAYGFDAGGPVEQMHAELVARFSAMGEQAGLVEALPRGEQVIRGISRALGPIMLAGTVAALGYLIF